MKTTAVQPVILCGGSGKRLWPLSRSGFLEQFLSLTGGESLFKLAAKRLAALGAYDLHINNPLSQPQSAKAPPPGRALGGGQRHRRDHQR